MKIVQLLPATDGWRALHYDRDDDEVYEVPLIGFALVEHDELEVAENAGSSQSIHAVGLFDLAPSIGQGEAFSFTDQDSTFVELAAPPGVCELERDESPEELIERIKRFWITRAEKAGKTDHARDQSEGLAAAER